MKSYTMVKNLSMFHKYLLSYFWVFFIPLLISILIFKLYFIKIYKEEVIQNHAEQSTRIGRTLDVQLKQLDNLINQIRINDTFRQGAAENVYHQIQMSRELYSMKSVNDMIFEIVYYQKNLDVAISSRNVMQLSTIDKFYFKYDYWDKDEMLKTLFEKREALWRPFEPVCIFDDKYEQLMTLNMPIWKFDYNSYNAASIQIQIEKSRFESILGISDNSEIIFIIMDDEGKLVYSNEKKAKDKDSVTTRFLKSDIKNNIYEIGGLLISSSKSDNGWMYINLLPLNKVMKKIDDIQMMYTLCMLALFVLGLIIIYILTNNSYKPFRELKSLVEECNFKSDKSTNEIEQAKKIIKYLNEFTFDLEKKLKDTSVHVKETLLKKLLQGKYNSIEEFNIEGKPNNIVYNNLFMFVVIVSDKGSNKKISVVELEKHFLKFYEVQGISMISNTHYVFVCATESSLKNEILGQLTNLRNILYTESGIELSMGISSPTADISTLYRKYIEAVAAMEYMNSREIPVSIYGHDMCQYVMYYPNEEIEAMKQSIHEGEQKRFVLIFNTLLRYVENLDVPVFMRTCVYYDVINALLKGLIEMRNEGVSQEAVREYSLLYMEKSNDIGWHTEIMNQLKDKILTCLKDKNPYQEDTLCLIKRYIEEHYLDSSFSAQKVADEFSISLPNLSAYFKENMNMKLIDYITKKKMNFTMQLLKDNEFSLAEIAEKTGYSSPSSFIRKFKQYTGMTPGEYSKAYKN